MMINTLCLLCGSNHYSRLLFPVAFQESDINKKTFSARRKPDSVHYALWKCDRCGLVYSNPVLASDNLKKLYQESNLSYNEQISYLKKDYGNLLKKAILNLPKKENFLEIGCGNGFMLTEAKKLGFKGFFGVEPSKEAVDKANCEIRDKITLNFFQKGQFKNNFFDLVCFFQTIDHILEPNTFLADVYNILKPGGKVICVCHNTDFIGAKIFKEKWPIFDIEHIFLFNKNNLSAIFDKAGFKVVETADFANTYPLSYWLYLLPIPEKIKKRMIDLLSLTRLMDFPVKLSAGNIFLIAEKSR